MSGIGVGNLPNQQHRRVSKKGASLTLLVVGESGLGKTTFINTLFSTSLCSHLDYSKRHSKEEKKETTKIQMTEAELEEKGFKLKLTLIDTPGFGDYVKNTECWKPVVDMIETQFTDYLNHEMQSDRPFFPHPRVHACLYFISPSGHSLKTLDIIAMKEIGSRVNLIPVIAKADTLTEDELYHFKERIRDDIASHEIAVYSPPIESDDDEVTAKNKDIASAMPYAVIGSESAEKKRGRSYPWGVAEVENDAHCDFNKLRDLLLRNHLLDIISTAEQIHYENFRDRQLEKGGLSEGMTPEKLKKDLQAKMQKQEDAMRKKFTDQVKQEENRFKAWEEKLVAEGEKLNAELDQKRAELNKLKEEVAALNSKVSSLAPPKKK